MPQSLSSLFGKTLTSSSGINTVANIVTSSATFGDTAILPQNDNKMQVIGNAYISGNLGIGTTATVKLDVAGNARVSGIITASGGIVVGATTSITVGSAFIKNNAVGLGTTNTTGRNAGISTAAGTLIFNVTNGRIEFYNGNAWVAIKSFDATGGTITFSGGKTIHTFTGSGTFSVNSGSSDVEYLVVAGGGGGGPDHGGGGGAGGFRTGTGFSVSSSPGAYTITVGGGGAAAVNGSDSAFGPIFSVGGGNSGNPNAPGANAGSGGSGGGGRGNGPSVWGLLGYGLNPSTPAPVIANHPTYAPGTTQGYPGGNSTGGPGEASAGGGGAGGAGSPNPAGNVGGAGGNGTASSISGSSVTYAGGGGGGVNGGTGGAGGPGGGGGGNPGPGGGTSGTPGTGGGGGGGGNGGLTLGGSGGSGIVIITYPS